MLEADVIRSLAEELDEAERSATQVEQISKRHPDMEIADSYAIQRSWTDIKRAAGRRILGHKIGLTSRAMQQAVNIDEPDYGVLFDDMFLSETEPVETSRLIEPRIEAEIAFVLARDLSGPDCTIVDVLEATSYVMPALELLDAGGAPVAGETPPVEFRVRLHAPFEPEMIGAPVSLRVEVDGAEAELVAVVESTTSATTGVLHRGTLGLNDLGASGMIAYGFGFLANERSIAGACGADLAPPAGVLDLADINAFVQGFVGGSPASDLNGDGVYDLGDIGLFVGVFVGGCP